MIIGNEIEQGELALTIIISGNQDIAGHGNYIYVRQRGSLDKRSSMNVRGWHGFPDPSVTNDYEGSHTQTFTYP